MIEGSGSRAGSGSLPLTNGSGSRSRRPKNTWIRWIRIRNTASMNTIMFIENIENETRHLFSPQLMQSEHEWSEVSSSPSCLWEYHKRSATFREEFKCRLFNGLTFCCKTIDMTKNLILIYVCVFLKYVHTVKKVSQQEKNAVFSTRTKCHRVSWWQMPLFLP